MLGSYKYLDDSNVADRQRWMAVLARATGAELESALRNAPPLPAHVRVRGPETGLVMVRGRQGGDGAAFNLGEMPVTRCAVRLADGAMGHAYLAGRDTVHAELAAAVDAALQDPARRAGLVAVVIGPLAAAQAARVAERAGKAAATRVEFQAMASMR